MNLQPLISHGPRIVAQIILLVVFVAFFGLHDLERFLKKEVLVVKTLKETDGIPSPAITIGAVQQINNQSCFNRNVSIERCLEKAFLKKSDIIKSVRIGLENEEEVNLTEEILREDFTFNWPGIYFTLTLPLKMDTDVMDNMILIGLNKDLNYIFFVHDREYFLLNDNPTAIPGEMRLLDVSNEEKPKRWQYRLELAEVNKLNLPTSPCINDPNYSFSSCVRKRMASKVKRKTKSLPGPVETRRIFSTFRKRKVKNDSKVGSQMH